MSASNECTSGSRVGIKLVRQIQMFSPEHLGLLIRHAGLAILAVALATSSLTFNWVIEHRVELNFFPEFGGGVVYLSDIFVFAGLAVWTVGWYLSPSQGLRFGPWAVTVPLAVLVILSVLSLGWATNEPVAVYTVFRRVVLFAMYVVLVTESSRALRPMLFTLFAIGAIQACVAVAQVVGGSAVGLSQLGELTENYLGYDSIGVPRAYGLGFNPNPVGMFMAVVSVLAYGSFLLKLGNQWSKGLALLIFIMGFFGLVATASRSAFLGWALSVTALSLLAWLGGNDVRQTVLKRIGLASLLIGVIELGIHLVPTEGSAAQPALGVTEVSNAPSTSVERITKRMTPVELGSGISGRIADWNLARPIVKEHLVLGVGVGNYPLTLNARLGAGIPGGIFTPPHNVAILVLAELGILGLVAWGALALAPLVWVLARRQVQWFEIHSLLWFGPLVVVLFVSLWDFTPWVTQDGRVLLWGILGLWAGGISRSLSIRQENQGMALER